MSDQDKVETLVSEYRANRPNYERCTERLRDLLEQMLEGAALGARIHSVTCRPKDIDKLREKLVRGDGKYADLGDVTDLMGLRVITYFGEDVDEVASIIEAELNIDKANSIDKRQTLDPDSFGYLSLHYVCTLDDGRAARLENASLVDLPFEIQVRSILQHAWAEIEHDLGYKTGAEIPAAMRRRFSRLAGLLEIADDEFLRLREDLETYANEIGAEIAKDPSRVQIDKASLESFVASDPLVAEIDGEMVAAIGAEDRLTTTYVERALPLLKEVGMTTVEDVSSALQEWRQQLVEEVRIRIEDRTEDKSTFSGLRSGVCLISLAIILAAGGRDEDAFREFLKANSLLANSEDYTSDVQRMVARKSRPA